MVAYCSDRYTENRDKQFCIESSLHWKPVECSEKSCCTCMHGPIESILLFFICALSTMHRRTEKNTKYFSKLCLTTWDINFGASCL